MYSPFYNQIVSSALSVKTVRFFLIVKVVNVLNQDFVSLNFTTIATLN